MSRALIALLLALLLPHPAGAGEPEQPLPLTDAAAVNAAQAKVDEIAAKLADGKIARLEVKYLPNMLPYRTTPEIIDGAAADRSTFTIRDLRQSAYRVQLLEAFRSVRVIPARGLPSVTLGMSFYDLEDRKIASVYLTMRGLQWAGGAGYVDGVAVDFSPGFYEAVSEMFFIPFEALAPQWRCPAQPPAPDAGPASAALDAMVSRLTKGGPQGNQHISQIEFLYLPSHIKPRVAVVTPDELQKTYAYKITFAAISTDDRLFQQLAAAFADMKPVQDSSAFMSPWGQRWGVIVGSDQKTPAGSIFLDAEGMGYATVSGTRVDKLTCSTNFARWLQTRFLPYFR